MPPIELLWMIQDSTRGGPSRNSSVIEFDSDAESQRSRHHWQKRSVAAYRTEPRIFLPLHYVTNSCISCCQTNWAPRPNGDSKRTARWDARLGQCLPRGVKLTG